MNRTALGVLALAIEVMLVIGLYNTYKPQLTQMSTIVFQETGINSTQSGHSNWPKQPSNLKNGLAINDLGQYQEAHWVWKPKGHINEGGKTNTQDLWELVTSGTAYSPNEAPSDAQWAELDSQGGQLPTNTFATKDGQMANLNDE